MSVDVNEITTVGAVFDKHLPEGSSGNDCRQRELLRDVLSVIQGDALPRVGHFANGTIVRTCDRELVMNALNRALTLATPEETKIITKLLAQLNPAR